MNLDIIHTNKYKRHSGHAPQDLVKEAPKRTRIRQPNISGLTSPPWKYGIIHSKLFVADRFVTFKICTNNSSVECLFCLLVSISTWEVLILVVEVQHGQKK